MHSPCFYHIDGGGDQCCAKASSDRGRKMTGNPIIHDLVVDKGLFANVVHNNFPNVDDTVVSNVGQCP